MDEQERLAKICAKVRSLNTRFKLRQVMKNAVRRQPTACFTATQPLATAYFTTSTTTPTDWRATQGYVYYTAGV